MRIAGIAVGLLLVTALTTSDSTDAAAPGWTRSYYISNPDPIRMQELGCGASDTSGRMTLFFGAPTSVGDAFGATLWGGNNRSTAEIAELVRSFAQGYTWCRPGENQIIIGVGTSTSNVDSKSNDWLWWHGVNWAETVRDLNAWAESELPGSAMIYGAWDAEPSWSAYDKAESWLRGYDSVPGRKGVHVNASADGCPWTHSDNGGCNNDWNQDQVWRLSWEIDPALPIPQIYATNGVNAEQWQKISEYGARHHNDGMTFYGAMSQHGACAGAGGCDQTDNTPQMAHDFLLWHLNTSPLTAQEWLESVTDMNWHS